MFPRLAASVLICSLLTGCSPAASDQQDPPAGLSGSSSAEVWGERLAEAWARPWVADVALDSSAMPFAQSWSGRLVRDGRGRYRFETMADIDRGPGKPSMRMLEISDGSTMWRVLEMPLLNLPPTVLIKKLPESGGTSEPDPSSGHFSWLESATLASLDDGSFQVVDRSGGEVTLHSKIPGMPEPPELASAEFDSAGITMVLDAKTALPRRLELDYGMGMGIAISYENARFATRRDWDGDTFTFEPPRGARVERVN